MEEENKAEIAKLDYTIVSFALMLILTVALIVVGIYYMMKGEETMLALTLVAIGFMSISVIYRHLNQLMKIRRIVAMGGPIYYTRIECPECGEKFVRKFKDGDYIPKKEKCRKCGKDAIITAIFSEKSKEEEELE